MLSKWFNHLPLRRKLFLIFFGFICIIVFVASMSFWFYQKREQLSRITEEMEFVMVNALRMIKLEQEFFENDRTNPAFYQYGRSVHLDKHRITLEDMMKTVQHLSKNDNLNDSVIVKDLRKLYDILFKYNSRFSQISILIQHRGFKDFGREGDIRQIMNDLEKEGLLYPSIIANLQRYEKDYLLRKDKSSIAKFNRAYQQAFQQASQLWVNPDKKKEVLAKLQKYNQYLQEIIKIDENIGEERDEQGLIYQIRQFSESAIELLEGTTKAVDKRAQELGGEFQNIFLITIIIVVVLSLTFSYLLSFLITIPITKLSESMQFAVEHNFTGDIPPARKYTEDEIGVLVDDFNLMIDKLQKLIFEISKQNDELKFANKQLALSEKRLERFLSVKETFFSIITQDLRGPLGSLKGFLHLMQNHPDTFSTQELQNIATDMYAAFDQINILMSSLLQWSQAQTDDLAYNPNRIHVNRLAEEVLLTLAPMARSKNIGLINRLQTDLFAHVDRDMLNFVFRNLVSNGVKFTHEGGMVEIFSDQNSKFIVLFIMDTGVGMSQNFMEQLFHPEMHVSTFGTHNERGSGFGLLMCKDFIEKNGGTLEIQSEVNKGTCVRFTLRKY